MGARHRQAAEAVYSIRCNGTQVHIDVDAAGFGPALDSEWGSEQCEGCGFDIVTTGEVVDKQCFEGGLVRCDCGANYIIEREER